MVTTARRPPIETTPAPPGRSDYELVLPWLAALTVVCSATALGGVISGGSWLGYLLLTEIVLVGCGLVLRILRVPTVLVAIGQMFALCCVSVGVFTDVAVAGFLPGRASLGQVGDLLGQSVEVIRNGVPPVEPSLPILCLAVISVGLVGIIVDVLVVPGQAPAAVGLMLLCVYAVPASLSDALLPWWTFLLGAMSFTALLATDRVFRQRKVRGAAGSLAGEAGPPAAAIFSVSAVIALLAGVALTAVGTEGRLPGSDDGGANGPAQLGIKPFTTLRGLLDQDQQPTELFRVRGLDDDAPYLRSLTLRDYVPNRGWQASTSMARGVPATERPLPGSDIAGDTTAVQIESVNWMDVWLPVYGVPRQFDALGEGWRYDPGSGIAYSQRARNPGRYVEQAQLGEPSAAALRAAPSGAQGTQVDPVYTDVDRIDPRVSALARRLTANAPTDFDKAFALYRYFAVNGGFTYSTETAAATDADALADFVLKGKQGFCEQYASAMAVMLRELDVPSRVAIGFTPGQQRDGFRSITSLDAHAWVEVYFAGYGWQTFDPTPLTDGRGRTPDYLETDSDSGSPGDGAEENPGGGPPTDAAPPPAEQPEQPGQQGQAADQGTAGPAGPGVLVWLLVAALALALGGTVLAVLNRRVRRVAGYAAAVCWVLVVVLAATLVSWWLLAVGVLGLLVLAPAALRDRVTRRNTTLAGGVGSDAVEAAWAEVAAQSRDRGVLVAPHDTLRAAAETLARAHGLDDEGRTRLRELVTVAERAWYRGDAEQSPAGALDGVLAALRRCAPLGWRDRLLPQSLVLGRMYLGWLPGGRSGMDGTSTDRVPVGGRQS